MDCEREFIICTRYPFLVNFAQDPSLSNNVNKLRAYGYLTDDAEDETIDQA